MARSLMLDGLRLLAITSSSLLIVPGDVFGIVNFVFVKYLKHVS